MLYISVVLSKDEHFELYLLWKVSNYFLSSVVSLEKVWMGLNENSVSLKSLLELVLIHYVQIC